MKLKQATAVVATAFLSTVGFSIIPANAEDDRVEIEASLDGDQGAITVENGSVAINADSILIMDSEGTVLRNLSRTFELDDVSYPIEAAVAGRTVTLRPNLNAPRAANPSMPPPPPHRIPEGAAIGAIAGSIPGTTVDCEIGNGVAAITGGLTAAVLAPFIVLDEPAAVPSPAPVGAAAAGCALGSALVGAEGALAGAVDGASTGAVTAAFSTNPPR
ncbi:hypothetical protein [Nocardia goodfellowii]|uniref:DUF8020 domain-containing protein n=1 Tax=Nocardia goodfellowii TaxID=882446 RepID=A0ABS4QGA5_9NOCA|nr:hypothetical protein [Nocardia goodfellowii]MBP2189701.1 hypothetical protein [Nocardia goodfellowii]